MTELNRANISDKEWRAFLTDIVAVQEKHGMELVPTMKVSPVTGLTMEWGGLRKEHATKPDRKADGDDSRND